MSFFRITLDHPEVAQKIQREIDDVIGNHRYPSIKDRSRMPYTDAAIWELLRYISHAPLAVPHSTLTEVKMRGYFIPANTTVRIYKWYTFLPSLRDSDGTACLSVYRIFYIITDGFFTLWLVLELIYRAGEGMLGFLYVVL